MILEMRYYDTLIKINHDSSLRFRNEILQSGLAFNNYDIQLTVQACMLLEDAHLPHIFYWKCYSYFLD
jgi:hypothetical protein